MKKTWIAILLLLVGIVIFSSCDEVDNDRHESGQQTTIGTNDKPSGTPDACRHSFDEWKITKQASCTEEGTRTRDCSICFEHQEEPIPKNGEHTFVASDNAIGYQCSKCSLKVIEHGNADGSMAGGNNKVKYYVTGDLENYSDFKIVVYGTGNMPNFSKDEHPMWQSYLSQTVKVTISDGITSIGAYAFYCPESETHCQFVMPDSVKTIKSYAVWLNITNLTLGSGVETVEMCGYGGAKAVYVPKSVKKLDSDSLLNHTIFYEGTLEEFYRLQLYVYNRSITVRDYLNTLDSSFLSNIHVYLQAKNTNDRSHYWR